MLTGENQDSFMKRIDNQKEKEKNMEELQKCLFAWAPAAILIILMIGFKMVYQYDEDEPEILAELTRRKQAGNEKIEGRG